VAFRLGWNMHANLPQRFSPQRAVGAKGSLMKPGGQVWMFACSPRREEWRS
jgi:hypothetical protein